MEVLLKSLENVDLSDDAWETPLHLAAKYSIQDAIGKLVSCDTPIDGRDRMFRTPLLVAVVHNATLDLIEALVSCGADVNLADTTSLTPLHIAVMNGDAKVVGVLLQSGADVDATDEENNRPLHFTRDVDVAQVLLEHGADVNARNDRLQGALHLVAGRPAARGVIELLLRHKAEMNARDDRLCTPLHEAVEFGQVESVEALLQRGADVKLKNLQFRTAFHEAACNGSAEIVELLLRNGADIDSRDERSRTPLHLAVAYSSPQVVDVLIRHGAEVDDARNGFDPLQVAVLCGKFDNAEVLLSHGADPSPALHTAVSYGQVDGVELLLRREAADVNARAANTGNTPLHVCRNVRVLQLLMDHGAIDVRARNNSGQTPVHTMCCLSIFGDEYHLDCEYGMVTEFLERGADVNDEDASGETPFTSLIDRYKRLSDCDIYDALELEKIIVEVVRHVKRLVVLGEHLSWKNQRKYVECMTSQEVFYRWFRRLLKKAGFDDAEYARQCEMELERLRNTWISRYTSLFDVIRLGSKMKMSQISANDDLKFIAESRDYKKRFPIYFYLIKLQYQRGSTLRPLYDACEVQLDILAPKKMNKLCIDGILQYLTEIDLKSLVEASI